MPSFPDYPVPDSDTRGLRHLRVALQDLPFPTTREALLERAGQWRIPMTGTEFVRLEELFEGVGRSRYRDVDAALKAVHHAHPEIPRE